MLSIFQISMALLVSLSGVTAAIAEGVGISAITVPMALATWFFVDFKRLFHLPAYWAPGVGVAAFVAAAVEYTSVSEPSYLEVGNHLLAYLTWILLCQQKGARQYWTLCALSLLQIAVTSLLTYSFWFGIALVGYCLLSTWTLSLFLLSRSARLFPENETGQNRLDPAGSMQSGFAQVRAGLSLDRHERLVTPRFCLHTVIDTGLSLVIAALFFLFIPRIWPTASAARSGRMGTPLTGFSTEMRLGDMGEILESDERVMNLQVFDAKTGERLPASQAQAYLQEAPLFRGAVLEEYQQGRWHRPRFRATRNAAQGISVAAYRLRIDLEGLGTEAIFTFGNTVGAAAVQQEGSVAWDYYSNEMIRSEETDLGSEFTYDLYTLPGPPDLWLSQQRQIELAGALFATRPQDHLLRARPRKYQESLMALLQVPEDLVELAPIAQRITEGTKTPVEAAQHIEDWFTLSGQFSYTMKLSVSDSSIDPILDFVQNRRSGHCEYFASSMAMMLRCVGIPSRVVNGFKGAVFDEKSETFSVYQYHAHAWVEAYLNGQWITYDPTPSIRDSLVEDFQGGPSKLVKAWRTAESFWHRFSTLSREGQNERIYQPLAQRARSVTTILTDLWQGRSGVLNRIKQFLLTPKRWWSIEGAFVILLLSLLGMALYRLTRMLLQAGQSLRGYLKSQSESAASRIKVPFYEQLLAILKEQGYVPQPSQTAREFIHSAVPRLVSRLPDCRLEAWSEEIVEKFYQVRFGSQALTVDERQELAVRLKELEKSLQETREVPA